jgi:regulatory protein
LTPEHSFDHRVELAVGRGLAFLGHRGRTIAETRNRLIQRGFDLDVADAAVLRLVEMGYLNDATFCLEFVEGKRRLDMWGDDRIRNRLRELGAPREDVEKALADDDLGELQRAIELLERRLQEPAEDPNSHRKAMGILIRRGFAPSTAADAIREHARLDS